MSDAAAGGSESGETVPPPSQLVSAKTARMTGKERSVVATSINAFGASLFQSLKTPAGNVVLSPTSAYMALALLAAGAAGETQATLEKALAFRLATEQQHQAVGDLRRVWISRQRPGPLVSVASGLFAEKRLALRQDYLVGVREVYAAQASRLDFSDPAGAARLVNDWVAEQTLGKIQDIVSDEHFERELLQEGPPPAALVLVNALYFRGHWEEEFLPQDTSRRDFWVNGTTRRRVPTMDREAYFPFIRRSGYSAVEMRYRSGPFSMVILLPRERAGIAAIEDQCLRRHLDACVSGFTDEYVHLRVPKFRIATAAFSLEPAMAPLGLAELFAPRTHQFSRMVSGGTRLYLRDARQKVFVEVDERGTEAGAATALGMAGLGDMPPEPIPFFVDRPFIFLIRDRESGAVLFVGRISDPT